jgi:hypothetical protein
VIHGDTLYAFTEVVGKDDNPALCRGHKNVGLVHFRHYGINQRNETVFEGERRVLIKKRSFTTRGLEVEDVEAVPAPTTSRSIAKKPARPAKSHARAVKLAPATKKSKPAKSAKPVVKAKGGSKAKSRGKKSK